MILGAIFSIIKAIFGGIIRLIAWLIIALSLWVPLFYSIAFIVVCATTNTEPSELAPVYWAGLALSFVGAFFISGLIYDHKRSQKKAKVRKVTSEKVVEKNGKAVLKNKEREEFAGANGADATQYNAQYNPLNNAQSGGGFAQSGGGFTQNNTQSGGQSYSQNGGQSSVQNGQNQFGQAYNGNQNDNNFGVNSSAGGGQNYSQNNQNYASGGQNNHNNNPLNSQNNPQSGNTQNGFFYPYNTGNSQNNPSNNPLNQSNNPQNSGFGAHNQPQNQGWNSPQNGYQFQGNQSQGQPQFYPYNQSQNQSQFGGFGQNQFGGGFGQNLGQNLGQNQSQGYGQNYGGYAQQGFNQSQFGQNQQFSYSKEDDLINEYRRPIEAEFMSRRDSFGEEAYQKPTEFEEEPRVFATRKDPTILIYEYSDRMEFYKRTREGLVLMETRYK